MGATVHLRAIKFMELPEWKVESTIRKQKVIEVKLGWVRKVTPEGIASLNHDHSNHFNLNIASLAIQEPRGCLPANGPKVGCINLIEAPGVIYIFKRIPSL
jgi:hypothetical protein